MEQVVAFAGGKKPEQEKVTLMPAVSEAQRRFFGAELGRFRAGKKTKTGLSEIKLEEFVSKPLKKKKRKSALERELMRGRR